MVEPVPKEHLRTKTLQLIVKETVLPHGCGKTEWLPPKTGRYGEFISASRPQIVCNECGVIDGLADPKPIGEVIRDGIRIIGHLEDAGYEFDKDCFFEVIRERKSNPCETGNDQEILAIAVDRAITTIPDNDD